MSDVTRRLLALCLPAVLVCSVDCGLTLCGQSDAYWARGAARNTDGATSLHTYPSTINEVNPTSRMLLAWHPLAFVAGTVVEMALLCSLILLLPSSLALLTSLGATLGHTWGATTWISRFPYGFQIGNGFFLIVAVILTAGVQTWYARGRPESLLGSRIPLALRWSLIGALAVVFIRVSLWPRA